MTRVRGFVAPVAGKVEPRLAKNGSSNRLISLWLTPMRSQQRRVRRRRMRAARIGPASLRTTVGRCMGSMRSDFVERVTGAVA